MKFEMLISHAGNTSEHAWVETDDRDDLENEAAILAWATRIVASFNATLKPYEKPRTLHSVRIVGDSVPRPKPHHFLKVNLVTLSDHRGAFDNVACEHCGCKARRYGLARIVRQKGFTAKKWDSCLGKLAGPR